MFMDHLHSTYDIKTKNIKTQYQYLPYEKLRKVMYVIKNQIANPKENIKEGMYMNKNGYIILYTVKD